MMVCLLCCLDMLATVFFYLLLSFLCYGQLQDGGRVCTYSLAVDQTHNQDCMSNPDTELHNLTCSSLPNALQLISNLDPAVLAGTCVEVVINQGSYTIEGTVILDREVLLRGREDHVVSIILLTPATYRPSHLIRNLKFL